MTLLGNFRQNDLISKLKLAKIDCQFDLIYCRDATVKSFKRIPNFTRTISEIILFSQLLVPWNETYHYKKMFFSLEYQI